MERVQKGDAPDYFCAESVSKIFLAEAKGRVTSVIFKNKEFGSWRKQFDRVVIKDRTGYPRSVKGFTVAARFATEKNSPTLKTMLFVEDPETQGDGPLKGVGDFGATTVAVHYSRIAAKLRQPILSLVLARGTTVPEELQFPVKIWRFLVSPLQSMRFVGGYFPSSEGARQTRVSGGRLQFFPTDPFRLDIGSGTFFGVEESVFRGVVDMARRGDSLANEIPRLEDVAPSYSGFSFLRDRSIIAPVEFLTPVEQLVL